MSDREMNMAAPNKQAPACGKCLMTKMQADGQWQCPNCTESPKTGQTIVIEELDSKPNGPVRIRRVGDVLSSVGNTPAPMQVQALMVEREIERRTNAVLLHVPVALFPELVVWARKLKLPKDWSQAAKIKAITDFQVELNDKLNALTKTEGTGQ